MTPNFSLALFLSRSLSPSTSLSLSHYLPPYLSLSISPLHLSPSGRARSPPLSSLRQL